MVRFSCLAAVLPQGQKWLVMCFESKGANLGGQSWASKRKLVHFGPSRRNSSCLVVLGGIVAANRLFVQDVSSFQHDETTRI